MLQKQKGKRPSKDPEIRLYASRVRSMTDDQIWKEGHKEVTLDLVEKVVKEMHQDILSYLAPYFDTETMELITQILGKWYGFDSDIVYVDEKQQLFDEKYNPSEDRLIAAGKIYRHFKGNYYQVMCLALDTETKQMMVVYQRLDVAKDSEADKFICCRPLAMFASEVDHEKYPTATQKWRFQRVEEVPAWPMQKGDKTDGRSDV